MQINLTHSIHYNAVLHECACNLQNSTALAQLYDLVEQESTGQYATAQDSLWGLTASSKAYLYWMELLLKLIERQLQHLLCRAENFVGEEQLAALRQEAEKKSCSKLKIVFFVQAFNLWPSLQTVFDACAEDPRCIAQLVYIPFRKPGHRVEHAELLPYMEAGYDVIPYDAYDLAAESPDVAMLLKPYDMVPEKYTVAQIDRAVKRMVYSPYTMPVLLTPSVYDYVFQLPLQAACWKWIACSVQYYELAKRMGMRRGENCLVTAHPRTDVFRNGQSGKGMPAEWVQKAQGKKMILYNANAMVEPDGNSTFLMYHQKLFEYFNNQSGFVLLWRPHPRMSFRLEELGLMSTLEWEQLEATAKKSPNIILDQSPSYLDALWAADAMLSDMSSLIVEFLMADKPVLFLEKPDSEPLDFEALLAACSTARTFEDVAKFCDGMLQGTDEKLAARKDFLQTYVLITENTAGVRIRDEIYQDLVAEENQILLNERV